MAKIVNRPFRGGSPRTLMRGKTEKAKNFKKTFKIFIKYLKPYRLKLILVLLFALAATAFTIASPKILGQMTDVIVRGLLNHNKIDFVQITKIGLGLICLYAASALFSYLQSWIMSKISQKITYSFRHNIAAKISRLPLSYFDHNEKGDIISRVTNDVETISQNLNQGLVQAITAAATVIGILIMMLIISWQMTLIALGILPLSFIFIKLIVKHSQHHYDTQQSSLGKINGHIEEMFSNHAIVKAFNGEERSINHFDDINADLYNSGWKSQFLSGLMMPLMHFISNLGYVAVAVVSGWLALMGKVSIGGIQAFIQYMNQFTQPITQTANIASVFQSTAAAAERIFEFLEEEEEKPETNNTPKIKNVRGRVEFNKINFGYFPDRPIIKDFTAQIKPKSRVAIVGPTGAGKTTIVNLLMRFYDIDSGEILIDGTNIEKMKRSDVRSLFGMVLQDTWLFNDTIAENIAFGKSGATREEIIEAAQEAQIDHLIRTMPNGYDTIISDSIDSISVGEKQLLTIARAILADAPMLILDEATSSVDTRTEILIQTAMEKLTKNRTSFVIAHRLSTIKNADLILVMQNGNIVEQGQHQELLDKKGFYYSLYNSQF
ncbi:MAG TPA: ABC transporter ATP-binding protein [bacterium]|jgi:ATP-binding cassette subfamily B protein|nr:ABC transporter ATP-binding protein [bacterium]HQQ38623.1 ABC transporter ATP-binding protein [bacterium]